MKFLCGCDMPSLDALRGDPALKTLSTLTYDSEGFLTCSVHGQRRSGWRSLPVVESAGGRRADHALSRYSELEIERLVIFGEPIAENPWTVKAPQEDWRFNVDPEEFWKLTQQGRGKQERLV